MSATARLGEQSLERDVPEAPINPTLMQAFWFWLKLGFISFGGLAGRFQLCIRSWSRSGAGFPRYGFSMSQLIWESIRCLTSKI